MSLPGFLAESLARNSGRDAVIWRDRACGYARLSERVREWDGELRRLGVAAGGVVAIQADFSADAVALFLALVSRGCVIVPLREQSVRDGRALAAAECELLLAQGADDSWSTSRLPHKPSHPLYAGLRASGRAGLVVFSSGTTGESKAALHDMGPLLEKFSAPRKSLRAINFLLFDHLGGINTMLYQLSNGGCIVTTPDRSPDAVLATVARHRVELLPVSPTFLNLVLLSGAHERHDLSSLRYVTYGTEPMPQSLLTRFHALFPGIILQQTYGVSEIGVLRTKSRASDSLWVKVGGDEFQTRVVGGILQVKSRSAMLGYLNHPSPFTEDGWYDTGDIVETDGEYLRFLGRKTDVINVGGEKVYPAQVESVLMEHPDVADAAVYGASHPISGNIVCANVRLRVPSADRSTSIGSIKAHCAQRLKPYMIPVKVSLVEAEMHGARFKKTRPRGG